jgi:hypothetical protein
LSLGTHLEQVIRDVQKFQTRPRREADMLKEFMALCTAVWLCGLVTST